MRRQTDKSRKRVALVLSTKDSNWVSCQTITPALCKAYQTVLNHQQNRVFSYTEHMSQWQLYCLAKSLHAYQPSHIAFVDHRPHPLALLRLLITFFRGLMPPTIVHAYGDFNLYPHEWLLSSKMLHQVTFLCASKRQQTLLDSYLLADNGTSYLPYCLPKDSFCWDPELRAHFRKKFEIPETSKVFVYTGRLSPEKNIYRQLQEARSFLESEDAFFFFVGDFDDIGAEKFGHSCREGRYENLIKREYNSFPPEIQARIHILAPLPQRELAAIYCGGDAFWSLSTYHDEDFGMSPLESLYCGTPVILSNWGGFPSFHFPESQDVSIVDIELKETGFKISSKAIQKSLMRTLHRSIAERQRCAETYKSFFSVEASAERLASLLDAPQPHFHGFSPLLVEYAQAFESFKKGIPLYDSHPKPEGLYFKIYNHYLDQEPYEN